MGRVDLKLIDDKLIHKALDTGVQTAPVGQFPGHNNVIPITICT